MKKGDIIKFGNYPQDSYGNKSPIEWLVLDVKGYEALLISYYGLDCKPYDQKFIDTTWEDCDLRKWLNNDFIKSAFSEEEAKKIIVSELKNKDNPKYGIRGGNNTKDHIFCLSIDEAKQYFSSGKDRQCKPTAYVRKKDANVNNDCCYWWLRSPGHIQNKAEYVCPYGAFSLFGDYVDSDINAVRPALRIIFDEEQERRQLKELQECRHLKELHAQTHRDFLAIIKNGIEKGMIIPFGCYQKTNIRWQVLDVKGNEALLISRYGLDYRQYNHNSTKITWEDCDLRKWLNNDFIKTAFSEEEVERIKVSELKNYDNYEYRTQGGYNTKDRIFCLSIDEANKYFMGNYDRKCNLFGYVDQGVVYVLNTYCWWLRSPGFNQYYASIVNTDGELDLAGGHVNHYTSVRPALWIILEDEFKLKQRMELEQRQREEVGRKLQQAQTCEDFLAIIKKGMIIPFGSYPQNKNSCKVPIEWLVLDVKGNEALLISRYGLDSKPYNHCRTDITWYDCDLRKWLNNDFIKSAFSEEEAKKIIVSELKNYDNYEYQTQGGYNTKDRIFCLSITEAKQYFSSKKNRQCRPTAHARNQGGYVDDSNSCSYWWLRSPGYHQDGAALVEADGTLNMYGGNVGLDNYVVRPALWIIIDWELECRQREEQERKQREEQERKQREEHRLQEELTQAPQKFLSMVKKGLKKGMIVPFGSYPQNENSSRVPIEWLVLYVKKPSLTNRLFNRDNKDNKIEALLISRYGLVSKPYNYDCTSITWEDCSLRKWLNNDFIKSAFSKGEAEMIKGSELKNEDNDKYRTKGGNNTKDRIFCLSMTEAKKYFRSNKDRQCRPTAYAQKQGAYVYRDGCCSWCLRSPGEYQHLVSHVNADGTLDLSGDHVHCNFTIRPALWIICNL